MPALGANEIILAVYLEVQSQSDKIQTGNRIQPYTGIALGLK